VGLAPQASFRDAKLLATLERAFERHAGDDGVIDFADLKAALGLKSDYLVRRVLAAFDLDANGVITKDEFLAGVRALVFGTDREKLRFAFKVHDHDGDGSVDRTELARMIGISLSEADAYRESQQPDTLARTLFSIADKNRDGKISFEELEAVVQRRPELLRRMTWSEAIWIAPNEELLLWLDGGAARRPSWWAETDWVALTLAVLLLAAHVFTIAMSLRLEPAGTNAAWAVGRALGRCIDLDGALIFFSMMRRTLTWIRATWLGRVLPVDESIALHKLLGHVLFALAWAHTAAFVIAYVDGHSTMAWFQVFASSRGATGAALLVVFAVMWVFSLAFIRRTRHFELFYFTHLLYWAWLVLAIAHAPNILFAAGVPVVGIVVERLLRTRRRKPNQVLVSEPLPSGVVKLEVTKPARFDAQPGDYAFLRIPAIAGREWHPFTISSAPERDALTFHIRSLGNWTSALRRRVEAAPNDPDLVAYVDGPYGTPSAEIFRSKVAVLIGAGIGVTPFASVLESLVLRANGSSQRPSSLEKVHFFWLNKDQYSFEWFAALLAELERTDRRGLLDVHLCMTGGRSGVTALGLELAREMMHASGRSDIITGLRTKTHMGPPDWEGMLGRIATTHGGGDRVAVFFCGPRGLAAKIRPVCMRLGMKFLEEKF